MTTPDVKEMAERLRKAWCENSPINPLVLGAMVSVAGDLDRLADRGKDETAWLIEWPQHEGNPPKWWCAINEWVLDANRAIRFARKVDATTYIVAHHLSHCAPTEHIWQETDRLSTQAQTPAQVSGDYVLVPREPTEEQLEAGLDESGNRAIPHQADYVEGAMVAPGMSEKDCAEVNGWLKDALRDEYKAMIAAANQPPAIGLDWKISDETKAAIEEIEGNSRRAMANAHNIIAGAPQGDSGTKSAQASRWPRKGDKVFFLGVNGYDYQLKEALAKFDTKTPYTVVACDVGNWSHSIQFEEVEGRYNGVMFERAKSGSEG